MKSFLLILLLSLMTINTIAIDEISNIDKLIVPDGFEVSYYVEYSHAPRSMVLGDEGTLFVGTRSPSTNVVYAYVDSDGDNIAETEYILDSELNAPNGVAFKDGALYVATTTSILRYDDIENRLNNPPEPIIVYDSLPDEAHHGSRYLAFSPDNRLYVSVGAPCNICEYDEDIFGLILSMTENGEDVRIEARGIRNTVGFDFHPETGELWFTDTGRDWISDDLPPDELNHISAPDFNFGFPYCHGDFLPDIDFPQENACDGTQAPDYQLPAHVEALGMTFYTGDSFPEQYTNAIFVAEHGSNNRTEPVGYRVSVIIFDDNGNAINYEPFVEGFLQGEHDYDAWASPVDVLVMPDGSLLISDDHGDGIYRVQYIGE